VNGDEPVLVEQHGSALLVTLNRPAVRNAVDQATSDAVAAALDRLDAAEELRVGVLTGAGPGFSSGLDLKAFVRGERPYVEGRGFGGIVERGARKPLIAAIEGFAVAGGLEVALACDLIVAGRGARLAIPEVKRGLVASGGALLRLPGRIPYHVAMELALTGGEITAARAYELGMVNRLVDDGGALAAALALAEELAAAAPLALAASKRIVAEAAGWPPAAIWACQEEIAGPVIESEDAREGAAAFAAKRPPAWSGR
jgi:enoyl-CoA hydratase